MVIILQVSEIPRCHNLIKPHLVRAYRLNVQEGQTPPGTTPSQSLPFATTHQIYQSAILPKLEYCSSVWDPHYQTEIDTLEGVHKFASKVVTRQYVES